MFGGTHAQVHEFCMVHGTAQALSCLHQHALPATSFGAASWALATGWLSQEHQQHQRSQQLLKQNIACLTGQLLTIIELWGRKTLKGQSYNATGLRGVALGLLPATRRGESVRDFKHSQKLVSDILWNAGENQETDSRLRKEIIIQSELKIHLLSPGISSNILAYLKWNKESRPTLHLLPFFGLSSFSAESDPSSCCLAQVTKGEGGKGSSGKATERGKKRDWVWQLEGMGRKGESEEIRAKSLVTATESTHRNSPGNPKHPAVSALNSLKASSKGGVSSPSSTHSRKMSSNYYNQVLNGGKCYWQLITLCIKIYVRVQT